MGARFQGRSPRFLSSIAVGPVVPRFLTAEDMLSTAILGDSLSDITDIWLSSEIYWIDPWIFVYKSGPRP